MSCTEHISSYSNADNELENTSECTGVAHTHTHTYVNTHKAKQCAKTQSLWSHFTITTFKHVLLW